MVAQICAHDKVFIIKYETISNAHYNSTTQGSILFNNSTPIILLGGDINYYGTYANPFLIKWEIFSNAHCNVTKQAS